VYEKFIARQPIFDEKLKIFANELLFRAGNQNVFHPRKEASSSVIGRRRRARTQPERWLREGGDNVLPALGNSM
jgi:hypothetical protein